MQARKLIFPLVILAVPALIVTVMISSGMKKPVPVGEATPVPEGEGWIDLLDDEHAPHWKNVTDDKPIFALTDGMIHIFGRTITPLRYVGYTGETFGDFELHLEFKVTRRANSGVFLRSLPNDPVLRGFEIQVFDDHGKPPNTHRSGAIYDITTPMYNMSLPRGEWNSFDITVRGQHVVVEMNGWKVIDTDFSKMTEPLGKFRIPYAELPLEGHLMLQDHGGEVWYRNIRIRKL